MTMASVAASSHCTSSTATTTAPSAARFVMRLTAPLACLVNSLANQLPWSQGCGGLSGSRQLRQRFHAFPWRADSCHNGTKARLADGAAIAVTRRALPLAADRERMASTGCGAGWLRRRGSTRGRARRGDHGARPGRWGGDHIGRWLGDTLVEPLMGPGLETEMAPAT